MRKAIMLIMILLSIAGLLSFSEPGEIDNDLNGELLISYEKNVRLIDGKLWILYYDVSLHPLITYLKLAREQEDGSFEVMELCSMNIATGVRSQLDCTFAVQDEEVTILYMKPDYNYDDVGVYKIHSNNLMMNYHESEFTSLYGNVSEMSLELSEDKLVLILLRGNTSTNSGVNSLYYEYACGKEFNGQDIINGPVTSKDNIYIHQYLQGTNNGWPIFDGIVITEQLIVDVNTGAPAIYSAPMEDIFRGGYLEEINLDFELPSVAEVNWDFPINESAERDLMYIKISGSYMVFKYANYETHLDTFIVYNSFPDAEHPDLCEGDSLWMNVVEVEELDWQNGENTIQVNNASIIAYCPIWVEGEVGSRMTIACTDSIYITGDLTYESVIPGNEPQTGYEYLGLVSDKSIAVKYKNYDPWLETIKTDNCDGVYIYGVLTALGEVEYNNPNNEPIAGNLQVEYLHPHGSTPAYEMERDEFREVFPYPDLNKFVYSDAVYFPGDQGFVMHSNDMPVGYPCCGFPFENEDYGNGIITPYGADYPWYNPAYPESSEDIVFDRGSIELYGALIERGFHEVYCCGDDPAAHYNNNWSLSDGLYGGEHDPCGYEINLHYDERLAFQNEFPPDLNFLVNIPDYRVTILQSTNGGDNFVQRYDQLLEGTSLSINKNLQSVEEESIIAFAYNCIDEYKINFWNTDSFCLETESISIDDLAGNIKSLRLLDNDLYFQDDTGIYELTNYNLNPLSELPETEFRGFNYESSDKIKWSADWQSYDLVFTFYEGDEYWQFSEIGESVYEYGSEVDIFNLEDIYLKINEQAEAQLFLHGREYNEDMFYLASDLIEALPNEPDKISEVMNIKVYPNPSFSQGTRSNCQISYDVPLDKPGEISIYNIKGQFQQKWQINGTGELRLDTSNYNSGVYLLQLKSAGKEIERKLSIVK